MNFNNSKMAGNLLGVGGMERMMTYPTLLWIISLGDIYSATTVTDEVVFNDLFYLHCSTRLNSAFPKTIERKKRKGWCLRAYLLVFGLAFGFAFCGSLTGFIGSSQQTISHGSQPHGSSTAITSPHSSHLYLSPFLFAKN
jgi:cytochrome c biogenesis protein CcdA